MLDDVRLSLAAAHYVDPAAAIASLGKVQGASAQSSWFVASVSGPPGLASQQSTTNTLGTTAAGVTTVTKTDSAGTSVTTTESPAGQTSTAAQTQTTTFPAISPATYTAGPSPNSTFQAPQPTYGLAGFDLLTQQAELAYEAFNLSLLLQGAMSDRFEMSPDGQRVFRSQAVLGFQVSAEADRSTRNAVAEVIVTVRSADSKQPPPSLVALLPRDKTYNVATVRQGSKALSLGGVAKLISLGVGFGRSDQSVYYVQDVDTVALQHLSEAELKSQTADSLRFGWEFRPVLDQVAVSPSPKQVFVVLSLPATEEENWSGIVGVETRWRKYDRKSHTVGAVIKGTESYQQAQPISVPSPKSQYGAVAAQINKLTWHYAGGDRVIVTVDGHIPTGTRVSLGDLMIDRPETGLILQTEQRVTFSAPVEKLAYVDAELIDPFGVSTPLLKQTDAPQGQGLKITKVETVAEGPRTTVKVRVSASDGKPPLALNKSAKDAQSHHVLVIAGGRVFGLGDDQISSKATVLDLRLPTVLGALTTSGAPGTQAFRWVTTTSGQELWVSVPTAEYVESPVVRVFDPFWGDAYRDEYEIADDDSSVPGVSDIRVLSADKSYVRLALTGAHLAKNHLQLRVGGSKPWQPIADELTDSLAVFDVDRQYIAGVRQVVIEAAGPAATTIGAASGVPPAQMHVIAILPMPQELLLRPRVLKADSVAAGAATRVTLQGAHFENLVAVRWNGQDLVYAIDKLDPTNLYVTLVDPMVKAEGTVTISLVGISGEVEAYPLTVIKPKP
jgi:hypothetical protein